MTIYDYLAEHWDDPCIDVDEGWEPARCARCAHLDDVTGECVWHGFEPEDPREETCDQWSEA